MTVRTTYTKVEVHAGGTGNYNWQGEGLGFVESDSYKESFGDFRGRASVANLAAPTLRLTHVHPQDGGRYWCPVAQWSIRTDITPSNPPGHTPSNNVHVSTAEVVQVDEGNDITMTCPCTDCANANVTWYTGPTFFENYETGTYQPLANKNQFGITWFSSEIAGRASFSGARNLVLRAAKITDAGRVWCELATGQGELDADRSSTILKVQLEPFTCDGKPTGLYADPTACDYYYQCIPGYPPLHRPCGYAGMVFNEEMQYCDWDFNVQSPCGSKPV
uniref:chitinase n=1 Tax=Branchiostoma floridae TaxID=7739 RepID=B7FF60_BRAFL|nr:TPA_inf: variable region-containing chitin-binding protein 3 [Branchiostoma floridae]